VQVLLPEKLLSRPASICQQAWALTFNPRSTVAGNTGAGTRCQDLLPGLSFV
jgi:hypothetical protein